MSSFSGWIHLFSPCSLTHTHMTCFLCRIGESGGCFEEQRYINTESRWAVRQLGGGERENLGDLGIWWVFLCQHQQKRASHTGIPRSLPWRGGETLLERVLLFILSARLGRWETGRGELPLWFGGEASLAGVGRGRRSRLV